MKALKITAILLGVLFLAYGAVWFSAAHIIQKNLPQKQDFLSKNGITITPFPQKVSGFPAWPALHFAGTLQLADGTIINATKAHISIHLLHQPFLAPAVHISTDGPATLQIAALPVPFEIQEFVLNIGIPKLPKSFTTEHLDAWVADGGNLPIYKIKIRRNDFAMEGDGFLTLDRSRQLAGTINTRTTGLEDLIVYMVEQKLVEQDKAIMAQSLMNLLVRTDDLTGETYIPVAIQFQNRAMFVGPIRVGDIGEIRWPDDKQTVIPDPLP